MNDNNMIPQFLDLLDQSGLPEDRKEYWVGMIASPDFSEADVQDFEAEIQAHMEGLNEDIRFLEFERESLQTEKTRLLTDALPSLQEMSKEASALMEDEFDEFKEEILASEKIAMNEIEGVRGEKESEEIEAIRKRLGKG